MECERTNSVITNAPGHATGLIPAAARERGPSPSLLIALNAALIFGACLISARWPIGTILAIVSAGMLIALSGAWQLMVRLFERRFPLNPMARTLAYLLPFLAMVGLPLLGFHPPQPANKRYPAESPSGSYTARVTTPGEYWNVRIDSKDGSSFREQTDFVANLNVYWCWDSADRLWIYNSDDGSIHYWQREGSTWKHVTAGRAGDAPSSGSLRPPDALLPDYARR